MMNLNFTNAIKNTTRMSGYQKIATIKELNFQVTPD